MRSYQVQEINPADMAKLRTELAENAYRMPVEDLYWITLPQDLLSPGQAGHQKECGPHYMAIEAGPNWIRLELLVRCRQKIRCDCISYATPEQREFMIEFLDHLIKNQDIRV